MDDHSTIADTNITSFGAGQDSGSPASIGATENHFLKAIDDGPSNDTQLWWLDSEATGTLPEHRRDRMDTAPCLDIGHTAAAPIAVVENGERND